MCKKIKTRPGTWFILALTMTAALLLLGIADTSFQPLTVTAQEPDSTPSPGSLRVQDLAEFGLSAEDIQPLDGNFDLQVTQQVNPTTVPSGNQVTFTIVIKNNGPNAVQYTTFRDDYPAQMQNVVYSFSVPAISNGQAKPEWLLPNPIATNGTVTVTVTGILNSASNATVKNTVTVAGFNNGIDTNSSNNTSSANVTIQAVNPGPGSSLIYFPIIHKNPPPEKILAYSENFDSGEPWIEFDVTDCKAENRSGQYWVTIKRDDRSCLPPADNNDKKPEQPFRTFGEFEVAAYHSEGPSDQTSFGLFINGAGGENYYYFRIWPNVNGCSSGGNWQLIRRRNGSETTLRSGTCHPAIKRGTTIAATNILRIVHKADRTLAVYVNNTQLGTTFTESPSTHLTGQATGVYVSSEDSVVLVKFDNFRVFKFP